MMLLFILLPFVDLHHMYPFITCTPSFVRCRLGNSFVTDVSVLVHQYAEVCEKRQELTQENARLLERLEGLEDSGEGNTGTAARYKHLKAKIDSLQDHLFKVETCESYNSSSNCI